MSNSNCCFLTCMQVSQETGKVVWYSHLLKNFQQFVVIHAVKGFGIVNEAVVDFFWNSLAFSMIQQMLAIWSLVPLSFLKPAWTFGNSRFMYCWSLTWRILSITLLACEMSELCSSLSILCHCLSLGFPDSSEGKESAWNVEDLGSTPESGRSPGEVNGNPLQYFCLENSMDGGPW